MNSSSVCVHIHNSVFLFVSLIFNFCFASSSAALLPASASASLWFPVTCRGLIIYYKSTTKTKRGFHLYSIDMDRSRQRERSPSFTQQRHHELALIEAANPPKENPSNVLLDYNLFQSNPFMAVRFIFECGVKLDVQPMTISTASILLHKFRAALNNEKEYDIYVSRCLILTLIPLIAAASIYLAGKIESQLLKIRDVINVTRATLHRNSSPLDLGEMYWTIRESIVQAELMLIRILTFDVTVQQPQKFLVHYLRSLEEWMGVEAWTKIPVARTSWAFVQDFHHDSSIIMFPPQAIAVAAIELAMSCFGCSVPLCTPEGRNSWQSIFYSKFNRTEHGEIMMKILNMYDHEMDILRESLYQVNLKDSK